MSSHASNRGFSGRRRLATSAVALVSLGALAVGAAVLTTNTISTSDSDVELASTSTCYDMVTVSVGGRNDTPTDQTKMLTLPDGTRLPAALADDFDSPWVDRIIDAPGGAVGQGSYAAVYVEYPADMASYENAVTTGVTNTNTVINAISTACPDTRFAIVGYSEGADVTRRAAMEIGNQTAGADGKYAIVDPNSVVGVVILADAGRGAGDNPFPGSASGTNPDGFDPKYQNSTSGPAGAGALPGTAGGFGRLDGRVASFCSEGDLTCAMPENTSLLHLAANVGRQLNVDALEREQLTPATGADLAMVIGGIAMAAFNDIARQDNWLAGDETFLDVLIKVSEPGYTPADPTTKVAAEAKNAEAKNDEDGEPLPAEKAVGLAYLPSKIAKEIIGFIGSNTNTVPVLMNDPYGLTLGPDTGHHFDYWRDSDPANGKPMTSAEYAAAWLTQLAKDAEAGKPIESTEVQHQARLAVLSETTTMAAPSSASASPTPTTVLPTTVAPFVAGEPVPGVPAPVVPVAPPVDGQAPVVGVEGAPIDGSVVVTPEVTGTPAPTTTAVPTTTVTPAP
ncbi:cutinase family protein [Rhodococcoides yunnanense]|uniref:cutinase family protein n=1 Tax=Rhodococcoides yunnanense TaxID=278209 RepID=UPI0022B09527|nr:cutinase family protein [Rhodococcus yunnanensis]MCZ4278800.1 cutinase family protein [Rhodococcus yunnanensis]